MLEWKTAFLRVRSTWSQQSPLSLCRGPQVFPRSEILSAQGWGRRERTWGDCQLHHWTETVRSPRPPPRSCTICHRPTASEPSGPCLWQGCWESLAAASSLGSSHLPGICWTCICWWSFFYSLSLWLGLLFYWRVGRQEKNDYLWFSVLTQKPMNLIQCRYQVLNLTTEPSRAKLINDCCLAQRTSSRLLLLTLSVTSRWPCFLNVLCISTALLSPGFLQP